MGTLFTRAVSDDDIRRLQQACPSHRIHDLDSSDSAIADALVLVRYRHWEPQAQPPAVDDPRWLGMPCICWLSELPPRPSDAFWNGWDALFIDTQSDADFVRIVDGLLAYRSIASEAAEDSQAAEQ